MKFDNKAVHASRAALLCCWLLMPLPALAQSEIAAAIYDSPETAAKALLDALAKDDHQALLAVLGNKYQDQLFIGEAEREKAQFADVANRAKEALQLRKDDENTRIMVIGKNAWPMPIPIKHTDKGWQFDTATGIDEILARRVGADELAAIDVLKTYVDAQAAYASEYRDGSDVEKYAQRIVSTPGHQDGLYWPAKEGEEQSPFGPFVAELPAYLQDRDMQKAGKQPYMGYYFRILTRQGENAPGGRYDYIINGNMIAGFAMIATPAEYGETGIMTFVVNHQGKIFEKDLGDDTALAAAAIQEYNPDSSWKLLGKDDQ